jgi:hypothetical protein
MAKGKTLNQILADKIMYLRKSSGFQLEHMEGEAKKARTAVTATSRISWSTLDDLAKAAAIDEALFITRKLFGQLDEGKIDMMDACSEVSSFAMNKVFSLAQASQGSSQGGNMLRAYELQVFGQLAQDAGRWVAHLMDDKD